jgi:mannose/cellobiose epimerase-like protein (N-acyl-D-glucosamine 2-epimerase family)
MVKKTQSNFSVRKIKPLAKENNQKKEIDHIFDKFDSDVGNFFCDNDNDLASEEQPSLNHFKYTMKTSKSKTIYHKVRHCKFSKETSQLTNSKKCQDVSSDRFWN